jgi:CheY-like chemotaxis protein
MPLAFLSYTRKDDEFFGGYITAFRKMLENAVHVVTGDTTFQMFQDIDGVVIGEKWQKKLNDALEQSALFVPMLSPLFFNSKACTQEVQQFLAHEKSLARDDLILPIYFLTSAKLEKEEEKAKDPLAQELATRQMVDWRERVHTPLAKPAARQAVLSLAEKIAGALNRIQPSAPSFKSALPRATPGATRSPMPARPDAEDPRISADVPANSAPRELGPLAVLWVDDRPENNAWERRALEDYGVRFTLARSTHEATQLLSSNGPFAAVVSDMGRPEDLHAGLTLLRWLAGSSHRDTPFFIYTSPAVAYTLKTHSKPGLTGITADPDTLVEIVLSAFR